MSTAIASLTRVESRLFLRDPGASFFALVFPSLLILVLGAVIPGFRQPTEDLGGLRPIDIYVPITLALAIATIGLSTLPTFLATYREKGVLRRLATTPARPVQLLGAQLIVNVGAGVLAIAAAYVLAMLAFDVPAPGTPVAFVLTVVVALAALCAIGLVIAAVAPNAKTATGIGMGVYFPMLFFAGVYVPRQFLPDALRTVSDFTPLGAASQALHDTFVGGWPQPVHAAVLVGYLVVAGLAAARLFRWE